MVMKRERKSHRVPTRIQAVLSFTTPRCHQIAAKVCNVIIYSCISMVGRGNHRSCEILTVVCIATADCPRF